MKGLLAILLVSGVTVSAFGYGGSYTAIEVNRNKKNVKGRTTGARSSSGAMVSELSLGPDGKPAPGGGAAQGGGHTGTSAALAPTSPSGTTATPPVGGGSAIGSFGSSSLGCPHGTDKDPATGRCVASPAATTANKGAAGAGATGTAASAATTGTTGSTGYGAAPGYGASGINAASAATQAVKQ